MKKILLMSDTHGFIDDQVLKYVKLCDEVWHAGDIGSLEVTDAIKSYTNLKAVFGNIDGSLIRAEFKENIRFMCEDLDVWITHIGGYPSNYDVRIKEAILNYPPKLFISGHSHILKVMYDNSLKLLHMNPGAVGKTGIHSVRTMLQFNVSGAEISELNVIELEKRA